MTLKREIKDAYIESGNSVYIKTHSDAIYVDENETETLTQRLDNVKDSITKHTSQLDAVLGNSRKLKFKINASPWWYSADNSTIDNDIATYKNMGVDGFTICVHILNEGTSLYIKEDLNVLLYAINKIKESNMTVSAIKMHCTQDVFDTASDSYNQYKNLVNQIADKFKDLYIPYFTFLNEVPNIYNNEDEKNETLINDLSTMLRQKGFKVGVTVANSLELSNMLDNFSDRISNYYDCFFKNTYPTISYKGSSTTKRDSLYAWDSEKKIFLKCKELFPDMPAILSECGCQHWWESLKNPAIYNWNEIGPVTDGMGKVAEIFYYGIFENLDLNEIIDELWMWYPEQMCYDTFYNFVKYYTKNEVI